MSNSSKHAAVVGAGPSGLMAAETLARGGHAVTIYERMPRVARKFLLAGRGGLNLTHSEPIEKFLGRYGDAERHLRPAIEAFPPSALRAWAEELGLETFVGTSGRVFPRTMKTSPLLRAWMRRLGDLGVRLELRHRWVGWDDAQRLLFETPNGPIGVEAAATVLALGGASWPNLGSDGSWTGALAGIGARIAPLAPANCGCLIPWSDALRSRFAGTPLKRIALALGTHTVRGEAIITPRGLEGGAVYALSPRIREALAANGSATLHLDLRPDETADALLQRLLGKPRRKQSLATYLRKALNLDPPAIGLLQETAHAAGTPLGGLSPDAVALLIKAVPLRVIGVSPLHRAISTAGGLSFDDLDEHFMLRARPGTFVAGEMLDWEAPTGGYLLQACFATAAAAARGALTYLARQPQL